MKFKSSERMGRNFSGPEFAVLVDLSDSAFTFSNIESFNSTDPSEVSTDGLRRITVWGGGSVGADVINSEGICIGRLKILDLMGKQKDLEKYPACGRLFMDRVPQSRRDLLVSGVWEKYALVPGLVACWMKTKEFRNQNVVELYRSRERLNV